MPMQSSNGESAVLYKDRKEWADLTPIPQNDSSNPVVKISYTEEFEDCYDYFRGVMAVKECSERALALTEDCLNLNAANYTVWQYRRLILEHLGSDLNEELEFSRGMIEASPKNYQVWHHRRVIVTRLGDGSKELRLTSAIFSHDAKNYHAWEHRQWALRSFKLYDGELQYIEDLLEDDVYNNSAWNHRYFVLTRTSGLDITVLRSELQFLKTKIYELHNNESPWNYLKGILNDTVASEEELKECWSMVETWCWDLLGPMMADDTGLPSIPATSKCRHLLTGLLDCISFKLSKLSDNNKKCEALNTAVLLCDLLGEKHDEIRYRYWQFLKTQLQSKYSIQ